MCLVTKARGAAGVQESLLKGRRDGKGSGKWKETRASLDKCSGFANNRPSSVIEDMSCGQGVQV